MASTPATFSAKISSSYSETGHMGRNEKDTTYTLELTRNERGEHDTLLVHRYEERDFEERRTTLVRERRFAIDGHALAELIVRNGKEILGTS